MVFSPRPGAAPVNAAASSETALERLNRMRREQTTLWGEIRTNWAGWLCSVVMHATVIACLALFVVGAPVLLNPEPPPAFLAPGVVADPTGNLLNWSPDSLDILTPDGRVDSEIPGPSSVKGGDKVSTENPGYFPGLEPGRPPYIGQGMKVVGIGDGDGIPGLDDRGLAGRGRSLRNWVNVINDRGLEVVFVFDSTGSMGAIIQETKARIRQLMGVVTYLVPPARLGLVTYRDQMQYDLDNYEYTTKSLPLTTDVTRLEEFLRGTEAFGGGDIPEAVYEGLQTAINEEHWSQGTVKVIIVFGDAPPHPENDGLNKVNNLITRWHKETGGVVSCIDTTGGANLLSEFKDMAAAGGGDAVSLARTEDIAPQLVTYIFGSEYKEPLEKLANYLNKKKTEDVNVIVGEKDAKP